jgi:hypothetical protein
MRKHRELGWFGWLAYGLFLVAAVGFVSWATIYAVGGGLKMALTETLPFWLPGIGGPAALVAIYETSKRTRQVERSVGDIASANDGAGQKSGAKVTWKVEEVSRSRRRIVNLGSMTASSVTVEDVTNPAGRSGFFLLDAKLPCEVPIKDAIEASMNRSLADPYISRGRVALNEGGEKYEATYSVS